MKVVLFAMIFAATILPDQAVSDNKAPGFYARTLEGKNFFLSDNLGKGRNIFLSFFATWCVPCKQEIPVLDSLKNIYSSTDFYLINVSGLEVGGNKIKEDPKKVREFIDMLGVSIPVLMDKYGRTALAYDALTLPTSVMIDSEGEIIYFMYYDASLDQVFSVGSDWGEEWTFHADTFEGDIMDNNNNILERNRTLFLIYTIVKIVLLFCMGFIDT